MIAEIKKLIDELKALPYTENRQRAMEGLVSAEFYLQKDTFAPHIVQKPADLIGAAPAASPVIDPLPVTVEQELNADISVAPELEIKVLCRAEGSTEG